MSSPFDPAHNVVEYKKYKALSFDIFGTLLDWEGGLYPYLNPIISQLPASHPLHAPFPSVSTSSDSGSIPTKHPAFVAFDAHESRIMAELPTLRYETALAYAFRDLATQFDVSVTDEDVLAMSTRQDTWPSFADTADALRRLGRHYKLVALSNVSHDAVKKVLEGPFKDVKFDAVYTAQDIGSYKPALENFEYLLEHVGKEFGVQREQLLHVAHGVPADLWPADALGIDHAWVARDSFNWGDLRPDGLKRLVASVHNMKEMADNVDRAFAEGTNGA